MASGYSEWTSPRQQDSPPKRQRVKDLRDKFEALSDKSGSHKQGSSQGTSQGHRACDKPGSHKQGSRQGTSQEPSYGSGAAHHGAGSRQRSSHRAGPSTEYSDSLNEAAFRYGPSHQSEYSDSLEEHDQPSFSNVLESTRIDGREGRQPSGDVEPTGMEPEGFQEPIPSAPRGHADPAPSGGVFDGFQYPARPAELNEADESSKDEDYYHKWYLENMEKAKAYDELHNVIPRLITDYLPDFEVADHYSGSDLTLLLKGFVEFLVSNFRKVASPVSSLGGNFDDMPDDTESIHDPEILRQQQILIDSHATHLPYEEEMEDSVFLPDDTEADRSMKKYLKQLKYRHILPTFGPDEDSVDYYNIRYYTTEPYLLDVMERNFYNPPESQPYSESSRYFPESSGGTQSPANLNETFTRGPDEEGHSAPSSNRSYKNQEEDIQSPRSMGRRGQPANLNETFTRGPDEEGHSAPSSNRSYKNQEEDIQSPRSMGRRGQPANLNETFTRGPDEERHSAQSSNRSYKNQEEDIQSPRSMGRRGQPANLNETFTRGPDEERHSAQSSNRSYKNQEEDIQSPRSMGRRGQTANLNETFTRGPDEERHSAQSSNRSYSNQEEDIQSPRSIGQPGNLNETFFYVDSPQQLNRSYSNQEEENIYTTRTESERQPQDLNRRLGSDDFNRGSDLSYDSHVSSPRRSKHSSGYQASSPHTSDSSHGPPRPQLRRRRRALPNINDSQSTSSASDPSRRPNLNEAQYSSGLISMSNDDRSRRRHTSDPHSTKTSLTSRSSAPRDLDDEELAETNTMESGSDEPGSDEPGRRGAGYFISDVEEHLGTRKLEPKPNTSNARWEAFQDQLREYNRQAAQSGSDSYSATDHTHSSEQEHSHSSQEQDGSAVDVPEDANETGSYRAPSPDMLGRQWAPGDLNEMLRRMHAPPQHGSRRGSPENVHEQDGDRRVSPQQEGLNRGRGPGDFPAQFERMQGEARGSAPSSYRSHSSQEGTNSPGSQSRVPQYSPPQMLMRRWGPEDFTAQFSRMQDEPRNPAASAQRSNLVQEDAHAPRTQPGRASPQTMNRRGATSDFDEQLGSGSSTRRSGQSANLNETFIRSPDGERHGAPSSNRSYSNQEDIHSSRSSRSMGREQPANLNETFFYMNSPQQPNRSSSRQEEENIHSPRTEPGRQLQDLNRRWGPDDFNQQPERQPQDLNRRWNPDDFNQQPGSSNATSAWDEGCF